MERLTKKYVDTEGMEYYGTNFEEDDWREIVVKLVSRLATYEDAEEHEQILRLPFKFGSVLYVVCKCADISMHHDNDYEHGTGAIECPYESQCCYHECDDEQKQVLETLVECIFYNDDGLQFGLSDIHFGHPNYSVDDIGKRVFLTRAEAEQALKGE